MPKKRLIWQLFPLFVLVAMGSLVLAAFYATHTMRQFYHSQREADLETRAKLIAPRVAKLLFAGQYDELQELCAVLSEAASARVTIILPDGKVLADSDRDSATMDNHGDRPEVQSALQGKIGRAKRYSYTLKADLNYVAIPIMDGGTVKGIARIAVPEAVIFASVRAIYWELAVGALVVVLFVTAFSLIATRTVTRPVELLKRGAERFAQGDLMTRLPVPDTAELGQLADAMNTMATQLEDRVHAVERQRNELEVVLSSMVEGVIAFDTNERVISLNTAAAEMFHIEPQRALNRDIHEVIRNTELQRLVAQILATGEPCEGSIVIDLRGEEYLHLQGTALSDPQGARIGGLVVLHDVTRLIRLETARRDFVANVSHELKTPITAIKGYVETLLDGALDDPDASRRFIEVIDRQADRLSSLIEDLLRLSRIEQEAEGERISLEDGDVLDVIEGAAHTCEAAATAKGIRVRIECEPGARAPMNAPLLQLAVENLIENAIKYSEEGTEVFVQGFREGNYFILSVQDHGCGIEKEHLPRVFERFYRVDKARSRKLGGTGLGLAIVKHIVRVHGGKTTVDSTPHQGSTFRIHIPLTEVTSANGGTSRT